MSHPIHDRLQPIRRRQRMLLMLRTAAWGLLIGSLLAIPLALARLSGAAVEFLLPAAVVGGGLLLGTLVGCVWPRQWRCAATAVDQHYQLKDRAATALAFLAHPEAGELHALQIEDAARHLKHVDPRQVVPFRVPATIPVALIVLLIAGLLVVLPSAGRKVQAAPAQVNPVIHNEAETLEKEMLKELEELLEEMRDPELEKLVEELREVVEQMQEPGVDERQALAQLSEMQALIAATQAEFNLEAMDSQLEDVGKAIAPADAMQAAARSLEEHKYSQAAENLEQFDSTDLSDKEAKTVAENLKQLASELAREQGSEGELSKAASELAEGLENKSESECKSGSTKLAELCKQQGLRKGICKSLDSQMSQLAECKSNMNGGQKVVRSERPRSTWGKGVSNQPTTDKGTKIESQRKQETISGMHGDGPSEREVENSPEGRQTAGRGLKQNLDEYRKQAEAVLESEQLPLGHRQTIRRYFESIRPDAAEAEAVADGAAAEAP